MGCDASVPSVAAACNAGIEPPHHILLPCWGLFPLQFTRTTSGIQDNGFLCSLGVCRVPTSSTLAAGAREQQLQACRVP